MRIKDVIVEAGNYNPTGTTFKTDTMPTYHKNDIFQRADQVDLDLDSMQSDGDTESSSKQAELKKLVANMFDSGVLNDREKKVLSLRFGIGGQEAVSLGQVSDIIGVTPERVRQIEARAMRKLRHPDISGDAIDF